MTFAMFHSRVGLVAHASIEHACVTLHLGGIILYFIFWLIYHPKECLRKAASY